jgi:5-methylcytosine-specific restriction endonuclease McrA
LPPPSITSWAGAFLAHIAMTASKSMGGRSMPRSAGLATRKKAPGVDMQLVKFLRITRQMHNNHKRRAAKYYCELDYSLADLRGWFSALLGAEGRGECRCNYCRAFVNLFTIQVDHRVPLVRGGDSKLSNLAPACEPCNDAKGNLLDTEFLDLMAFLENHSSIHIRPSVLERLAKAEKLAAVHRARLAHRKYERQLELEISNMPAMVE